MKKIFKTANLIVLLLIFNLNYSQEYDLIVKNGFLIDAKNKINKIMDVAIKDGRIASVQRKIDANLAKKIINAKGLIVTPGLIDIHTHNFYGTVPNSGGGEHIPLRQPANCIVDQDTSWSELAHFNHNLRTFVRGNIPE